VEVVARDICVGVQTLERWRAEVLAEPALEPTWSAASRLNAVIVTAAMDEAGRNAWCREHGIFPQQLQQWQDNATEALADSQQVRVSQKQAHKESQRIKELERELRRKERALAEAAALLVLSKKVEAIFNKGEDE